MSPVAKKKDSLEMYWVPNGSMMDMPVSGLLISGSIMLFAGLVFSRVSYLLPSANVGAALLLLCGSGLVVYGFEFFAKGLIKDEILRFRRSMAFINELDLRPNGHKSNV